MSDVVRIQEETIGAVLCRETLECLASIGHVLGSAFVRPQGCVRSRAIIGLSHGARSKPDIEAQAFLEHVLQMDGLANTEASDAITSSPRAERDGAPHHGRARILLADDLDLNRKLIDDILSFEGHEMDSVSDGAAAVVAASTVVYDLILMDMIMPIMDGLEATRIIRALPAPYGDVPIVALTANAFREHLDACLAAGMDATVTKPMSMDALVQAVDTWRRRGFRSA